MQTPIHITFRDIPHDDAVERLIREKADKLDDIFNNIISCHVVIHQTQKHQQTGKLHDVSIKLSVPGKDLASNHHDQESLTLAVRESFDSIRRQLDDYVRRLHGQEKNHAEVKHGVVVRKFDAFGFIRSPAGNEYYFNRDNVIKEQFEKLEIGTAVHFIEAIGNEGPMAHRVSPDKVQKPI